MESVGPKKAKKYSTEDRCRRGARDRLPHTLGGLGCGLTQCLLCPWAPRTPARMCHCKHEGGAPLAEYSVAGGSLSACCHARITPIGTTGLTGIDDSGFSCMPA